MKEQKFGVDICGLSPLSQHNPDIMLKIAADRPRDHFKWEKEHWLDMTYRDGNGGFVIPRHAIRGVLREAVRFTNLKPPRGMGSLKTLIESCMVVESDAKIEDADEKRVLQWVEWVVVRNMGKAARIQRCRPLFPLPWKAYTTIMVFDDFLTLAVMQELADSAGHKCGLMEARKLGYGRCEIELTRIEQ